MAFVIKDRVQQTGTAVGTSRFDLSGNVTGFQSFSVIGNSNTTYYSATDVVGNWEVGLGVYYSGNTSIQRSSGNVLSSSNNGFLVGFPGAVTVFCTYPSAKAVYLDSSNSAVFGSNTDIFTGTQQKLTLTNGVQALYAYSNNAAATSLNFYKSRSNTAYDTVLSTDTLGNIVFNGSMSNFGGVVFAGAYIQGAMDGTPTYDDDQNHVSAFPTRISFYNRNSGYSGTEDVNLTESMRLSNTSVLSIGGAGFYLGSTNSAASYSALLTNSNGDLILSADPNNSYGSSDVITRVDNIDRIRTDATGITQFTSNLVMVYQGANVTKSTTATLTPAELVTGILTTTGTSYTITLPSGANIESALTWAASNVALDFFIVNTASGNITINANSNTLIGNATIATINSAQLRIRRTATNTFTVYRLR
jgi:hypothetical protein